MTILKNPYALLVIGIIAIIVFLGIYNSFTNTAPVLPSGNAAAAHGWTKGGTAAAVTLVEYGDFQCPACKAYQPIVDQIAAAYGVSITYTFKVFPLPMHKNAIPAALAAEAAGAQGKYWEMADILFAKQDEWADLGDTKPAFDRYAQSLGLDVAAFNAGMLSGKVKQVVADSRADGEKIGVNYTPYFILNGERIDNPQTVEAFYALINSKLPANQQVMPHTTTSSPQGAPTKAY